ncbi:MULTISPECIES: carbohydrate ABC transporter permease [unclassified Paenibacillus]|uniref:carbohydrate ABC transporter permease n=1 Tax=unclassified Paenibacillus TaxID=185978 RepID=UPI001C100F67|nr:MULTISPECIES: carbohydrate ABC transporter permease [unclassified Paenibacillus]MBU5441643.1 carbohydrate ABC transporter permease [Paenibacillus sp. MSJ-34]CAH0118168.1 L-arabinose transport system permease protein AraQ [Paenibacillus sp. CECT 9249]
MNRKVSVGRRTFHVFNLVLLTLIGLTMFLPFLNVIAQSLSSSDAIIRGEVSFWPKQFTWINYQYVFSDASIWRAFGVSVFVTVVGTFVNLVATASLAYPISRQEFVGRNAVAMMVLITMIFSAPLIPNFILIKELNLMNSPWALILPGAISAFNFFVMRSFFAQLPAELIDSSRIDGCGEMRIISSIVVPLSKPVMASLGIFYAVSHWNAYMNALYYINKPQWWPLQVKLKKMFETDDISIDPSASQFSDLVHTSPEGIKMAAIIVATLPIVLIYPFLQRHFVKGMMIGSIKS